VDFDHDHAGARDYLHRVLRTWARRGVDGFRCLHANLQDGDFWTGALAAARGVRPGLVFVADSKDPRHLAEGFDAVARPQFLETSSFAFLDDVAQLALNDGMWLAVVDTVFDTAGRGVIFLEDRFTRRATEAFPWPRGAGYAAALLTLPGHPQLYNGQEWGCRQQARLAGPSPLDRTVRHAGWEALYRDLLRLRAASEAVRRGESRRVPASNREILVYVRELPQETVLVAVNLSGSGPQFALPDDLAARRWRPWRDGAFGEPRALAGPVDLEPFGWRAWRAAD
jgi:glycosidase